MASTTDRALSESLLAFGREPALQAAQLDPTTPPVYAGTGYSVANVSRVSIVAALGREGARRRSIITTPTFDAAATYTLTVGAVTEVVATPASATALYSALAVALASSLTTYTVTASATSLTLIGPSALVSWTASGGTTALALATEYTSARLRIYSRTSAVSVARVTDVDDLETAQAWTLHTSCGTPCDYTIGLDGLHVEALPCGSSDSLRPYLTDLSAPADVCDTITYRDPVALVVPCMLGAS